MRAVVRYFVVFCLLVTSQASAQHDRVVPDADAIERGKTFLGNWYDALQRCYQSISLSQPFDDTGFRAVGDDSIDYAKAETRQRWLSAENHVGVDYRINGGSATPDGLSPSCRVDSVSRFRMLANAEAPAEVLYQRWIRANGLDQQTVSEDWPFESKKHVTLLSKTLHGTADGCPMYMQFQYRAFAQPETFFSIWETSDGGCSLAPRTADSEYGNAALVASDEFFDSAIEGEN